MDAEVKKAKKSLRAVLVEQRGRPLPVKGRRWWEWLALIWSVIAVTSLGGFLFFGMPHAIVVGGTIHEPLIGSVAEMMRLGWWLVVLALVGSWFLLFKSYGAPQLKLLSMLPASPAELLQLARGRWVIWNGYLWAYILMLTGWLGWRGATWLGSTLWEWLGWGVLFAVHTSALAALLAVCQVWLLKWRAPLMFIRVFLLVVIAGVVILSRAFKHLMPSHELEAWSGLIADLLPTLWGAWVMEMTHHEIWQVMASLGLVIGSIVVWLRWPESLQWKLLEYPEGFARRAGNEAGVMPEPAEKEVVTLPLAERIRGVCNDDELRTGWQERLLMRNWGKEDGTLYRSRTYGAPGWTQCWGWNLVGLIICMGIWMVGRLEAERLENLGVYQITFQAIVIAVMVALCLSSILAEMKSSWKQGAVIGGLPWKFLPISPWEVLIQVWKIMAGRMILALPLWCGAAGWIAGMSSFENFGFIDAMTLLVKGMVILLTSKPFFVLLQGSYGASQNAPSTGNFWIGCIRGMAIMASIVGYLVIAGFMMKFEGGLWWQVLFISAGALLLLGCSLMGFKLILRGLYKHPIHPPPSRYSRS